MKLVVNPPAPWPNWQAPVSTRKARPTIMEPTERAVEGNGGRANTRIRESGSTKLHCQSITKPRPPGPVV